MNTNLSLLLVGAPLLGFLINIFFGKSLGKTAAGIIGTLTVVLSFAVSLYFFGQITASKEPIQIQ